MFAPLSEPARAKINLALHVLGRRGDGYHELDSIVAFADAGDMLTIAPAAEFAITAEGPFASYLPSTDHNIIARAWRTADAIARARARALPGAAVHLVKNLPVAAGIGGGSANAAAALRGFLRLAAIDGFDASIMAAALALGADVPVCLLGKACRMQGVGEVITPLEGFAPRAALLVNPRVEVSTAAVFARLGLERGQRGGTPIADPSDPASWRNDLCAPASGIAVQVAEVIATLRALPGVDFVGMSGSGATCFALFGDVATAHLAQKSVEARSPGWWSVATLLR